METEAAKILAEAMKDIEIIKNNQANQWIIYIAFLANGLVVGYMVSFMKKLATDHAARRNIGPLTHLEEEARDPHAIKRAEHAQRHQLSMAALEKRMEVLQEAFVLWWELRSKIHGDREPRERIIEKCQDFWIRKNLYLGNKVRGAFYKAYITAIYHSGLVEDSKSVEDEELRESLNKEIRDNWKEIMDAGTAITQAVNLPDIEYKKPTQEAFGSDQDEGASE